MNRAVACAAGGDRAGGDVVAVEQRTLVPTLQFSARVASQTRVDVGSTVTGRLQAVLVSEGAAAKKGQVLLRLESHELSAALTQAEAAGRQVVARLEGLRSTGVVSAQAAASQAARAKRAQTELLAPADGRVLMREVEPGQIVQPGKALLGLMLAGPVQIMAQVDERFPDQLRAEQTASVLADAYAAQRFAARVLSIAPSVDAQRGSIEVKLSAAGADAGVSARRHDTVG